MEIVKSEKVGKRVSVLPSQTDKKGMLQSGRQQASLKNVKNLIGTLAVR